MASYLISPFKFCCRALCCLQVVAEDREEGDEEEAKAAKITRPESIDAKRPRQKQLKKNEKKQNGVAERKKASEMDPSFAFEEADDGFGGKAQWDFKEALVKLGLGVAREGTSEIEKQSAALVGGDKDEGEGERDEEGEGLVADAVKDLNTEEALVKAARRKQRLEDKEGRLQEKERRKLEERRKGSGNDGLPVPEDTDADPKAKEFFQELSDDLRTQASGPGGAVLFSQLNLSRPLLRAIESLGYVNPTPIQTAVIPVVLAGKDVCASAVTGSGKTAAFALPILERLLFRPKRVAATRVLILSPTRELAVQTHSMLSRLSQYTDMVTCLVVGGSKNMRVQESELRARPDIVVCTPGRMLDHLMNSPGVSVDDLEILVLDEVDQLVDLGFAAEVESLVKECPRQRQTLLFSATMTAKVDALAVLALNRPVRVRVDVSLQVAPRLEQEFVRVRGKGGEEHRHAILLALLARTFKTRTLVFCNTKADAHRTRLLLELSGIKAVELHGNLTQAERLESLLCFKEGKADVLVATDLAARGLDISGIAAVINAEMPRTRATYVHRVGRTARAGCGGKAVSLVPDALRLFMKQIVQDVEDTSTVKSRVVPPPVLAHYEAKVSELQAAIEKRLEEEAAERQARWAEMEAERAQNLVEHQEEIMQRPAKQWFQSKAEKEAVRTAAAAEKAAAQGNGNGKLSAFGTQRASLSSTMNLSRKEKQALEESAKKKKRHRLNRAKRRRMEMLKEEEGERREAVEQGLEEDGDLPKKRKLATMTSQKSVAREAKRAAQPTRVRAEGKAAGAIRVKTARGSGSAGTLQLTEGFDKELDTVYRKKGGEEPGGGTGPHQGDEGMAGTERESAYKFRGLSATSAAGGGLRKRSKPSHHAFKSKSKHRRR